MSPRYLAPGMLYSDEAVVYSVYQGIEYGQKPSSNNYLSVHLVIGDRDKGEIRVGYHDENPKLLPEEQRMLDEIARMLNLALDRKELKENLISKQREEAEFKKHLEELEREITERTRQLEEQRQKLQVVNSYLDRVQGGWEESRATLETMFKAIPDEVVLIDPRHKIVMTNRSGIQPGTICYASFFNRERPCEDCRLARIMRDKAPVTLTMKRDNRLCHGVGSYCSTPLPIIRTCIETTETYCCFNSRLSRIINEQGRAQLGRSWGGAQGPDCSGFALAQLQALDFSRMDLREFYAEIAPTLPNLGDLQQRAQQKVNSELAIVTRPTGRRARCIVAGSSAPSSSSVVPPQE